MASIVRKITQFTKKEIDQLWKDVHQVDKRDGILLLKAPRSGDIGRILIIVPKKIGNAPTRNKIRRQIKSLFYENKLYQKDFDWIILVKKSIKHLTFAKLQDLLLPLMSNQSA